MSENQDNPRKRPRLEDEGSGGSEEPENTTDRVHEEFNFTDGHIYTFRVQNTLFKVHRYLLTRDSEVFSTMFDLPSKNPNEIIDVQDPVEEFTALCWALYAFLRDSSTQFSATADVRRLLNLARIANKYGFIALEEWATTVLTHHCRAHNRLGKCTYDEMADTLELADRCTSTKFRAAVEEGILARLDKDAENVPWSQVLRAFELYGRRPFRGMVYYYLLQATERTGTQAQPSTTAPKTTISLNLDQLRSVQTGYWSLTKFLDQRFPSTLPSASCSNHAVCQKHWTEILKNLEKSTRSRVDVLGRLNKAQRYLQKLTNGTVCTIAAAERLEAAQAEVVETMADHFFGVAPQVSKDNGGNGTGVEATTS